MCFHSEECQTPAETEVMQVKKKKSFEIEFYQNGVGVHSQCSYLGILDMETGKLLRGFTDNTCAATRARPAAELCLGPGQMCTDFLNEALPVRPNRTVVLCAQANTLTCSGVASIFFLTGEIIKVFWADVF